MSKAVEVMTVTTLGGSGIFRTYLGGIDIIPDPSVPNGFKRTAREDRIFISPMNYDDIKGVENAEGVIVALNCLQEVEE